MKRVLKRNVLLNVTNVVFHVGHTDLARAAAVLCSTRYFNNSSSSICHGISKARPIESLRKESAFKTTNRTGMTVNDGNHHPSLSCTRGSIDEPHSKQDGVEGGRGNSGQQIEGSDAVPQQHTADSTTMASDSPSDSQSLHSPSELPRDADSERMFRCVRLFAGSEKRIPFSLIRYSGRWWWYVSLVALFIEIIEIDILLCACLFHKSYGVSLSLYLSISCIVS